MKHRSFLISAILLLCGISSLFAGDTDTGKDVTTTATEVPAFRHGAQEVQLVDGAMLSLSGNTTRRPELNYAIEAVRYGYIWNDVYGPSFWHGNDEFLVEAFGGEVFKGPGNALGGGMIMVRHNFVNEGCPVVPYVEIGGGALDNDIYHDQSQRRIGEAFEFTLHGGAGLRWMINNHWAFSVEGDYRHISNANLASRNSGLDSLGGLLGLNYLF